MDGLDVKKYFVWDPNVSQKILNNRIDGARKQIHSLTNQKQSAISFAFEFSRDIEKRCRLGTHQPSSS